MFLRLALCGFLHLLLPQNEEKNLIHDDKSRFSKSTKHMVQQQLHTRYENVMQMMCDVLRTYVYVCIFVCVSVNLAISVSFHFNVLLFCGHLRVAKIEAR